MALASLVVTSCGSATPSNVGTGGAVGTGGTQATGGVSASGGASTTGGAPGSGGAQGIGGAASGGTSSTGGVTATGGTGVGGIGGMSTGGGSSNSGGQGQGGRGGTAGIVGAGGGGGLGGAGGAGGFALTSPSLMQGAMFLPENTCAGANQSPRLNWTAGPVPTMSYAIMLTDMNNSLRHWMIWDIPAATRSLPAMLATTAMLTMPDGVAGARQVANGGSNAYTGPCPSGQTHTYLFDLHAIDVAMLPGLAANASTAQASMAILAHSIAKVTLSGQSNARRP